MIIWYLKNITRHLIQMLPCMGAALLIWGTLRPIRLRRLRAAGLESPRRRELLLLLYVLFCTGLCALTLFPYGFWEEVLHTVWDTGYRPDLRFPSLCESLQRLKQLPESITPFREILRVNRGGPWLWFVLWGNIGMFAPVGFSIPLLWRNRRWYHAVLFGALFSTAIEFIQLFVGRVSDVDDIILNTTGAFFGFLLYITVCKVLSLDKEKFHCRKKEAP